MNVSKLIGTLSYSPQRGTEACVFDTSLDVGTAEGELDKGNCSQC